MRFAEIVTSADKGERVKITHYGKTIAVLISTEDLRRLQDCETARQAKGKKPRVLNAAKSPTPRATKLAAASGRR
ncbi:MAG TPA: type II toxin-antitoxin system prevent-host-death family antitoxin [Polyangia bacterium]